MSRRKPGQDFHCKLQKDQKFKFSGSIPNCFQVGTGKGTGTRQNMKQHGQNGCVLQWIMFLPNCSLRVA